MQCFISRVAYILNDYYILILYTTWASLHAIFYISNIYTTFIYLHIPIITLSKRPSYVQLLAAIIQHHLSFMYSALPQDYGEWCPRLVASAS